MHRDSTEEPEYYKYTCDTCGSYSRGLMSGYFGTQYYNRDGSRVYDGNGRRISAPVARK